MKLIEISKDKYINITSICSVKINTRIETKQEDLGFGMQSDSKKIGETFTITIVTADGAEHRLDESFSEQVYDTIFPSSSE